MFMINKAKYLSLLVLLGAWGCTTNKNVSNSGGAYDDLYGGNPNSGLITNNNNYDQDVSRSGNPDYSSTQDDQLAGTSDYYDDSYLSSRSVGRALSPTGVGYNAGFNDGYNLASRSVSPFYNGFNGLGSYWPGSSMGLSFGFGLGNMMRIRPYLGFGMGSMMSMGYSPWGYNSMMGYGSFGYDPFGYNSFGYSPYNSMYGFGGYDSFYGYGGGYGYGYNPYAYNRPVIVVNNVYDRQGLSRSYGPRTANSSRSSDRYNSGFVNNPRSGNYTGSDRGSRRSANSVAGNDSYSSPRSSSRSGRGVSESNPGGRSSAANGSGYSRGNSEGNNVYYSRPRSSSASNYTSEGTNSGNYSSPRSSRSSSSYTAPSRSESNYSSPARSGNSYSSPSRSTESYNAPTRTYSAPSYSAPAPSRSYSAPASSGGGGGGGASRSSGRGPR